MAMPDPPQPKNSGLTSAAVTGGSGLVVGGVFSFAILPNFTQILTATNTASAWLYTFTLVSMLILLILVTGYLLLQRGAQQKMHPAMAVAMAVFGTVTAVGVGMVVYLTLTDPVVKVQARLGSDSDLASIEPPLKLAAFFDLDPDNPLSTSIRDRTRYPMRESQPVVVEIANLDRLKAQYAGYKSRVDQMDKALNSTSQSGNDFLGLAKKACIYVPRRAAIYDSCAFILTQMRS